MNIRPKPGECEDDLLRMQEEYLFEKSKDQYLKPAAQVTNLKYTNIETESATKVEPVARKQSKYAQSRGLRKHEKSIGNTNSVIGDVLEKNIQETESKYDNDNVYYPEILPSILGSIVEKNTDTTFQNDSDTMPSGGFPTIGKYDPNALKIRPNPVIDVHRATTSKMECSDIIPHGNKSGSNDLATNIPHKSYVLSSEDSENIHSENVSILNKMTENDILEEQKRLFASLDPKIIKFIQSKRKSNHVLKQEKVEQQYSQTEENMEIDSTSTDSSLHHFDTLWENDILSHPKVAEWLHFNDLEKDKLEWMKGIEDSKTHSIDAPYEARFDFKGYLLPYTIDYTESTKTLFHHGDEPHRPGYTLTELFELSRSSVTQQRVMALNTIAGVLEYFNAGIYKDVINIPISKIFFIIRIAIDENKVIILEPALKAMRNLILNRIDEAALDALLGFETGIQQPCLKNDMSEIEDLEAKESELKDFHLAEIDIISALIRTNILQRIYYILETIRPSFNCVQYCLQILTRLARDSEDIANHIVQTEHLMTTVINNFIPKASVNFEFKPQIVYNNKPVLAALKFIRVLSAQAMEISATLVDKYLIMDPISEYISSGIDGTYGLRVQIECYAIITNFSVYKKGAAEIFNILPLILTTMYIHVKGTDIFADSSVTSATHAGVLLQLVNTITKCSLGCLGEYKEKIQSLICEGLNKWFGQLSQSESYTCAHLRLISSSLDCATTILPKGYGIQKSLRSILNIFLQSKGFATMVSQVNNSSNLLSCIENKDLHSIKNLVSLSSFVVDSVQRALPILSATSPIPFLLSLFRFFQCFDDPELTGPFIVKLKDYLLKISKKPPSLCDNWFTRIETDFIFTMLKVSLKQNVVEADKDMLYSVANKLCHLFRKDKRCELEYVLSNLVFNREWFTAERLINLMSLKETEGFHDVLSSIEDIKNSYKAIINWDIKSIDCTESCEIVLKDWKEPLLPRDWIYLPILNVYSKSQEPELPNTMQEDYEVESLKEMTIKSSLSWIIFNEICFPDLLDDIDITDRFCRVVCIFLCDNSLFLNCTINLLLKKCVMILFRKEKKTPFNFNKQLVGLSSFQDFYTQLLEQFQAVSYGDHTFAACVLVPLANTHDIKWRKLLWSEYAGCLRALDCPEEDLCYDLKYYLHPEETDASLLRSYFNALTHFLVRPDTIAFKIASHHINCYKK